MVRIHSATVVLVGLFAAQLGFAWSMHGLQPYWTVLPPVPSDRAVGAEAFGDNEFLYRDLVMDLQNFGDTGGHWTALKAYDMAQVVAWLKLLDRLDVDANHHVTLAARYFSQTQNKPDLRPLVDYIRDHVAQNPAKKLQWLSEAIFLSQIRLHDEALALQIADQLATYDFPVMTLMAYQLPAVMHEHAGDFAGAAALMEQARQRLQGRISAEVDHQMERYVAAMFAKQAAR